MKKPEYDNYVNEKQYFADLIKYGAYAETLIAGLTKELEERTHQYHLAHAKILSREALASGIHTELKRAQQFIEIVLNGDPSWRESKAYKEYTGGINE